MPTITRRLRVVLPAAAVLVALGGTLLIAAPKEVKPFAPTNSKDASLVGIWTGSLDGRPSPIAKYAETVIFGPQGDLAIVGEAGTHSEYGHYTLDGPSLIVTLNRAKNNARTTIEPIKPQRVTPTYSITNGLLTVHPKDGSAVTTRRRVSDYPAGISLEAVAAQQAALLGSKTPAPSQTSLTEAQILAGLRPVQGMSTAATEQRERVEALHQMLGKEAEKRRTHQQSLARYDARFQEKVKQAFPGSDSQTLARVIKLERNIGGLNFHMKTITEFGKLAPERKDIQSLLLATQRELKPLLAEEAWLFLSTLETRQHLQKIHTLAVQCRIKTAELLEDDLAITTLHRRTEKNQ